MATVQEVSILNKRAWRDEKGDYRRWLYQVVFDEAPTDPADALDADDGTSSIPAIGDNYPGSTTIKCRKVGDAEMDEDAPQRFEVAVEFSDVVEDDSGGGGGGTIDPDPLSRPADIEWGFAVYERALTKGWDEEDNEVPIANTAGDEFDPPLTREMYRLQVTIGRNVNTFNAGAAFDATDTINSSSVTIAGLSVSARQAMIKDWSAHAAYENGTSFIRERIVVEFAPTFDREIQNRGFEQIDGDGNKVKIRDDNGVEVSAPQFLDENGTVTDTATYVTFRTNRETNFAGWNLPTSFPDA